MYTLGESMKQTTRKNEKNKGSRGRRWGLELDLEDAELLLLLESLDVHGLNLENVEADSLGKRTALAKSDDIPDLDPLEGRAQVSSDVLVALLITIVLADEVQVVTTDDDGPLHLGGGNNTTEDTSTDGDVAGEGALLVDVVPDDGRAGGLEAEANIAGVAKVRLLGGCAGDQRALADQTGTTHEDGGLLLISGLFLFESGSRHPVCLFLLGLFPRNPFFFLVSEKNPTFFPLFFFSAFLVKKFVLA